VIRATRSLLFSVIYPIYLQVVMGTVQELVIRPLCALNPKRRTRILRSWLRCHAIVVLGMARHLGGLRLHIQGTLPEASSIILMNHQSLLDIPVAVLMTRGPCPIIPTREKYTRGISTISRLARLCGFPSLSRGTHARREEHRAMVGAAEAVANGERTLIIYPEGHRTHDGELQPFMPAGLQLVFRHAHDRPVYVIVADGLWRLRSLADITLRIAGSVCRVQVLGPFTIPADTREHAAFIASLRSEMLSALTRLRAAGTETARLASRPQPVG
jgi:1-acyl-sn-glycerol-3-phosphate acyltransferase